MRALASRQRYVISLMVTLGPTLQGTRTLDEMNRNHAGENGQDGARARDFEASDVLLAAAEGSAEGWIFDPPRCQPPSRAAAGESCPPGSRHGSS